MALNATFEFTVKYRNTYTTNTAGTATEKFEPTTWSAQSDDGTGSGQANKGFTRSGTLTATSTDIDLYSIANTFQTLTNSKLKLIVIFNDATGDGEFLTVGGSATNPWSASFGDPSDKVKIGPGLFLPLGSLKAQSTSPLTIDSTHRNLKLDSGSATIAYRIVFLGV